MQSNRQSSRGRAVSGKWLKRANPISISMYMSLCTQYIAREKLQAIMIDSCCKRITHATVANDSTLWDIQLVVIQPSGTMISCA